jgi:hypothetical protein
LEEHAKSVRNWTQWRQAIEDFLAKHQPEEEESEPVDEG